MNRVNSKKHEYIFWLLALSAVILSLLWPGDTYWGVFDQIPTIDQALQANAQHRLSSYKAPGSAGMAYHPFPIWIYQFYLSLTHDLILIILIKQFIILCACLAGLYFLAKNLALPVFPIFLFFSSQLCYLWLRFFFDDSFLIPLSLFLFVSYACFYKKRSYFSFVLSVLCVIIIIHIHARGMVATLPFMLAFLLFEYKWLKTHWHGVSVICLIALILCCPYFLDIMKQLRFDHADQINKAQTLTVGNVLFAIISGGILYSYDFLQLVPDEIFKNICVCPGLARAFILITMISYLFIALGMLLVVSRIITNIRKKHPFSLVDRLGVISILTIVFHVLIINLMGIFNYYYFHSAIWFCSFFLLWVFIKAIQPIKLLRYISYIYIAVVMVIWLNAKVYNHIYSGYSISNAIQIAKTISKYSPDSDIVQIGNSWDYYTRIVDGMITNADNAVFGFYYKSLGIRVKNLIKAFRHRNLLFESLRPLVYIFRQNTINMDLPVQTLIIICHNNEHKKGELVEIIDDPERVQLMLNNLKKTTSGDH